MPRTFTFTPTEQDQTFAITVVRDEQTVIDVSDGNAKLQLSISTTRGGSPIVQIPSTGGKFDLRPDLLESLDEGMTYQHNIWDYTSSADGKRIATGTFTHAESIESVDIAYPTVTLPNGTLRIFVTQAQYDSINPKDPNAEYIVDGQPVPVDVIVPTASNALADQIYTRDTGDQTVNAAPDFINATGGDWSVSGGGASINNMGVLSIPTTALMAAIAIIVTYTNPAGSASSGFSVTVEAADEVVSLRQQIEGLRDGTTLNGRQSTAPLKVVGVDTLPAGATLSENTITVSGTGVILSDWDLSAYKVNLEGTDNQVVNNFWNAAATSTLGAWYFVDIDPSAVNPIVEYNTMDGFDGYGGPGTFINMNTTGSGAGATGAVGSRIRHNKFIHPNSDVGKWSGNDTLIEFNYFGPLTNVPPGTLEWDVDTNYAIGDAILYEGNKLFFSKVNGNVGNQPPSTKTDNAFWDAVDPHGDANTITASNDAGVTLRNNLIDWSEDRVRAVGTTQAWRVVRNTGSADQMAKVEIYENVVTPVFDGFYPMAYGFTRQYDGVSQASFDLGDLIYEGDTLYKSLQDANKGNLPSASPTFWEVTTELNAPGPVIVRENWIGAGKLGGYFSGSDNVVSVWTNNRDAATDALISPPVLRSASRQVTASVGQSEQVISLFKYASASNKQDHPPLLSGVDGILFVSGKNSDSGLPETIPVTQANIEAGNINPGGLAYFNFMHHVSGGRPQALVDVTWGGTGMDAMMDDDNVSRDYFVDAASVANAADAGFPVDLGVYAWSNAEASASSDLISNRNPHLIGRNPDGTEYDFAAGALEHCLIDTTGRGFGLLPNTAKLSLMLFHSRVLDAINPIDPPNLGYLTKSDGSGWAGMTGGNKFPAVQARKDFLAQSYLNANRGKVGVAQAISLYGDYIDGVKQSGESSIHPSVLEADGQILAAQHFAAHVAYAYGYIEIPSAPTFTTSADGLTVTGQVTLPAGTTLETIRRVKGQTVASPRPHQQPVMGISIWRDDGSFSDLELRPIWRVGQGPSAAYEGTVTILDAAAGTFKITLSQALADGDIIDFGGDGQYGGFSIYGQPDYAARMYQDALIAHDPNLYAATGYYGVPVEPQVRYTVAGVGAATDTTPPTLTASSASPVGTNGYEGLVTTNEGNGSLYWLVQPAADAAPSVAQVEAGSAQSVTTAGEKFVSGTGLLAATSYRIYYVQRDAAGNASAVVTPAASFTTAATAEASASRTATDDAYLTGPNLAAGTKAITFVIDAAFPADPTNGYTEIMDINGSYFKLAIDLRLTDRRPQIVMRDSAANNIFGVVNGAAFATPTGRHKLIFTGSLDTDGAGAAVAKLFVDGVEVISATGVSPTAEFPTNRGLEIFRSLSSLTVYSVEVYAGTHAQGYTATGDVTGLTLLHTVSGAATNWNSPAAPLVKVGVDSFT